MSAMNPEFKKIVRDGLWNNNIAFSQSIGLCPLLAVTGTATNGLGMGLATVAVMVACNMLVSYLRALIPPEIRIPVFVVLIAMIVTLVDMVMNAWLHEMHKVLGLFIPLIVTNCAILGRVEAYASRRPLPEATMDGLMMGLGFTFALVVLGAGREILGAGTLFASASLLLGDSFSRLETVLIPEYRGFLLMALPPGGFLMMGFILAGKKLIDRRLQARRLRQAEAGNQAHLLDEATVGCVACSLSVHGCGR
jgi:electron transport complex protein RnfE